MCTQADAFLQFVGGERAGVTLLAQESVVRWLLGDLSFLPKARTAVAFKELEDEWGRGVMRRRRPDLKLDKQWTNKFGEHICEELYTLMGKTVTKPARKCNYQPDTETNDAIVEVKTQTYYTSGTAGEKILGSPFKYAEIPELYEKPLLILCVGGAERMCRDSYGNLPGSKCTSEKMRFLDFFRKNRIEFVGASDVMSKLVALRSS
jgi:hypothetical protein